MGQATSSDNERPQWAAGGARKQKKSNARNSRKNHQTPSPPPPPEFSQQSHNLVPTKRLLIAEDSTGHDYNTLFGEYLDHNVQNILIEEPYLDKQHQLINLLIFIELCVLKCRNLSAIKVLTRPGAEELQSIALPQIKNDLRKNHNILFEVQFSDSMHDREITLDNGYKISLGRGLHFFKKVDTRFGLGFGQYRFRKCQDCKITVFYVN